MGHIADWRGGQNLGLRTKAIIASSSALAAVTVPRPDPAWYVRGGAALERFWLESDCSDSRSNPSRRCSCSLRTRRSRSSSPVNATSRDGRPALALPQVLGTRGHRDLRNVVRVAHAPRPSVRSVRLPFQKCSAVSN